MSKGSFPHHTGGVVQVRHVTRYGAVPEALLEDARLSLDSRAVAAWLAVKPGGWQICVTSLRMRLAPPGREKLGKDLWQRIAVELQSAGYLCRRKVNGPDGQWNWYITFNPVPTPVTVAGLAGDGSAGDGSAAYGSAGDGQVGHKEIPNEEIPIENFSKPTTTTHKTAPYRPENRGSGSKHENMDALQFPDVSAKERTEIERLIALCAPGSRQDVLDEVEAIRLAGGIKRGVVGLTSTLIEKVAAGTFNLSAGHKVRMQRAARVGHALALKLAVLPTQALLPMSEEVLAMLPPNIRRNARASMLKNRASELGQGHNDGSNRDPTLE